MIEIPKIVRARLRTRSGEVHPDANVMSAFLEQALASEERLQIVNHLSRCAECRELAILAAPELEELQLQVRVSPQKSWLSWPVLRWGAAIACVVVVGTAVTLHFEELSNPTRQMAAQISDRPVADAPAVSAPAGDDRLKATAPEVVTSPVVATSPAKKEAVNNEDLMPQATMAKALQAPRAADRDALAAGGASIPGRAKDQDVPIDAATANLAAAAQPFARVGSMNHALKVAPRWTLASDGTLLRSTDSGSSWETISVAEGNTSIFRALAASGADIWVGGTAGALYHSMDAGQHWTQVQPAVNGATLSSDITGVEFPDPQHGKITTAQSETWTTDDAGNTWQKQ